MNVDRVYVPLSLPPAPDRDASLDELARRYYACHAGADARDLAYWSGLPLRDCRPPTGDPIEDGPVGRVDLPMYDELLLGWRDRSPTVPPRSPSSSTRAAASSAPSPPTTASSPVRYQAVTSVDGA